MKTLNIDSPVGKRLAQVALFERLQAYFNLHPQKVASAVRSRARQNNLGITPVVLAMNLKERARMWIEFMLRLIALKAKEGGGFSQGDLAKIVNDESALSLCKCLDWYPNKLLKHVRVRAKLEGLNPVEFADYLAVEVPLMVVWAFDQAVELLKKQDK